MTQKHYVKGFSRMALTAAAFVALSVACSETLVPNEPGRGGTPQIADGGTGVSAHTAYSVICTHRMYLSCYV